eukprot:355827-Chlamydomonas_euryale.AAC.11
MDIEACMAAEEHIQLSVTRNVRHVPPNVDTETVKRYDYDCQCLCRTGRTGMYSVPPNNYPHYKEAERYTPAMQSDGGQLSEWTAMYEPSKEQAEADRAAAYEKGVPHGFVESGDKYSGVPTMELWVVSDLHEDHEYGAVDPASGKHSGGPFKIKVAASMRVEDLRLVIRVGWGNAPPTCYAVCENMSQRLWAMTMMMMMMMMILSFNYTITCLAADCDHACTEAAQSLPALDVNNCLQYIQGRLRFMSRLRPAI